MINFAIPPISAATIAAKQPSAPPNIVPTPRFIPLPNVPPALYKFHQIN